MGFRGGIYCGESNGEKERDVFPSTYTGGNSFEHVNELHGTGGVGARGGDVRALRGAASISCRAGDALWRGHVVKT